jgi:acyl dehydratase
MADPPPVVTRTLTAKDVALYASSIGADPVVHGDADLRLLYERHPRFGRALPAVAIVAAHDAVGLLSPQAMRERVPGYAQERALHGEHYVRLERPLRAGKTYETPRARVVRVTPKSRGESAVVVLRTTTATAAASQRRRGAAAKEVVAVNEFTSFVLGAGLQGSAEKEWVARDSDSSGSSPAPPRPPPGDDAAPPDFTARWRVPTGAAALYRLNGDLNPLHVDPAAVPAGRFGGRPILHGLCTLGASALLLARAAGLDPTAVRELRCRFSAHVFPGDAIVIEAWRRSEVQEEQGEEGSRPRFVFRTIVERGGGGGSDGQSSEQAVAISQASASFFTDEEMRRFEIEEEQEQQMEQWRRARL